MLISVNDACVLQDNALDIRVSDQIEQLDELIKLEGHGEAFFAKTHLLIGFGLPARSPELRRAEYPDVPCIHEFGQARIAPSTDATAHPISSGVAIFLR